MAVLCARVSCFETIAVTSSVTPAAGQLVSQLLRRRVAWEQLRPRPQQRKVLQRPTHRIYTHVNSTLLCFVLLWAALPAYSKVGVGVAGNGELWLGGHNKGVKSCFDRVMADSRCAKDFFTYVSRGDGNCGCKASTDSLKVRGDNNADHYRINQGTSE